MGGSRANLLPPSADELAGWIEQLHLSPLPSFGTAEQFLQGAAWRRRRPITLLAVAGLPAAVCGVWLTRDTEDVVLVDAALSGFRRDLVVMHEAAHVLFGHRGTWTVSASLTSPSVPRRRFDAHDEWQAEWLATCLLTRTRGLHRSDWVRHESTRTAARLLVGG